MSEIERAVGGVIDGLDNHLIYTVAEMRRYREQQEQEQRDRKASLTPDELAGLIDGSNAEVQRVLDKRAEPSVHTEKRVSEVWPDKSRIRMPAKGYLADTMFWLGVFREHERIKAERDQKQKRQDEAMERIDAQLRQVSEDEEPKKVWNFEPYPISGSFAEQKAEAARMKAEARYYLEIDFDTNDPIKLLRSIDWKITAWNGEQWVKAPGYMQPEMDGLGGDADFDLIAESQVENWKLRIMGKPVPPKPVLPVIPAFAFSELRPRYYVRDDDGQPVRLFRIIGTSDSVAVWNHGKETWAKTELSPSQLDGSAEYRKVGEGVTFRWWDLLENRALAARLEAAFLEEE